ncbi:MAG: hypothetical protein ABSD02_15720 [Steroidobacteraceae bacterium]|jgi:hypothetical protein
MSDPKTEKEAWYRYPMMWLVIAPPVGSVIAGIITMILILKHPDPVLATSHPAVAVQHAAKANSLLPPTD